MPSYENYQNSYRTRTKQQSPYKKPKNMIRSTELGEKSKERLMEYVTFFRLNPTVFIDWYFGIKLYPYQKLMIHTLQNRTLVYIVASRATAKSWIIGLWALTLAVLYPGMDVVIASKTLRQAGLIVGEKIRQMANDHPIVAMEIDKITDNANVYMVSLKNGSKIHATPSNDNSRGLRANYLILEESRIVPETIMQEVLFPFLTVRTPPYRTLPEYSGKQYIEEPRMSFITSCGYKGEHWWESSKDVIKKIAAGDKSCGFLAFDYLLTLYHGIKTVQTLRNETANSDRQAVMLEYGNIPLGSSGKSYFKMKQFPRTMQRAFYPQRNDNTYNPKKNPYGIDRTDGEIRMVCVDVATKANTVADNSIISCLRMIPLLNRGHKRQLVYMESHKGMNTVLQASRIKEIWHDFEADYIVLDYKNVGVSIFDNLSQITKSEERGIDYPALTVVDDDFVDVKLREELKAKTLGLNALPVVFPISATQTMNSQIAVNMRVSLQKKLWEFLIPEFNAEEFLLQHDKTYISSMSDSDIRAFYLNPYIQTTLFIGECINLEMSLSGGNIVVKEKEGFKKDRYTSVSYGNHIVSSVFDPELTRERSNESDLDFLRGVTYILN